MAKKRLEESVLREAIRRYFYGDNGIIDYDYTEGLDIGKGYFRILSGKLGLGNKKVYLVRSKNMLEVKYGLNSDEYREEFDRMVRDCIDESIKIWKREPLGSEPIAEKVSDKEEKKKVEKIRAINRSLGKGDLDSLKRSLRGLSKKDLLDQINRKSLESIVVMLESGDKDLLSTAANLGMTYTQTKPLTVTAVIGKDDLGLFDRYSKNMEMLEVGDTIESVCEEVGVQMIDGRHYEEEE